MRNLTARWRSLLRSWRRLLHRRIGRRCRRGLRRSLRSGLLACGRGWRGLVLSPKMENNESDHHRRYQQYREDRPAPRRAFLRRRRFGFSRHRASRGLHPRLDFRNGAAPLGIEMQAFARDAAKWLRNGRRRIRIVGRGRTVRCIQRRCQKRYVLRERGDQRDADRPDISRRRGDSRRSLRGIVNVAAARRSATPSRTRSDRPKASTHRPWPARSKA